MGHPRSCRGRGSTRRHGLSHAGHLLVFGPTRCSNDYPHCKELSGRKGNITADPRFVDAASGNVHLLPGSPAIDAGVAIDGLTVDYDGVARPQGNGVDIGAFEYRP